LHATDAARGREGPDTRKLALVSEPCGGSSSSSRRANTSGSTGHRSGSGRRLHPRCGDGGAGLSGEGSWSRCRQRSTTAGAHPGSSCAPSSLGCSGGSLKLRCVVSRGHAAERTELLDTRLRGPLRGRGARAVPKPRWSLRGGLGSASERRADSSSCAMSRSFSSVRRTDNARRGCAVIARLLGRRSIKPWTSFANPCL
jgi:hypothetical protein